MSTMLLNLCTLINGSTRNGFDAKMSRINNISFKELAKSRKDKEQILTQIISEKEEISDKK